MNSSEGLHWSFDYNYGLHKIPICIRLQLVETFLRLLCVEPDNRPNRMPKPPSIFTIYFQMYWRGYATGTEASVGIR